MTDRLRTILPALAGLGLALLLAGCGCREAAPASTAPNVLFVSIDTLRADHVGAYGAREAGTPTLDRLATEGVLFENAFAAAPITLPSHATLLTGRLPPRHGVRHNGVFRLDEESETLAGRLREAGHATAAFVGAVVLDASTGLDQGFDTYDASASPRRATVAGFLERRADAVTDAAVEWLRRERRRPFFLWVHYYDPHATYDPPPPFDERFAGRPYQGEIAYTDAAVGRLVDALREAGEWERTLTVVTSDHGESLGEHGEASHSYTLYDAAMQVPLIVRGPGIPAGGRVADVVSGADVAPTIAAEVGVALPQAEGRDLSARIRGGSLTERPAYAETLAPRIEHGWAPLFAMRSRRHLYVRAPRPELYDVSEDPHQRRNLLEEEPERARETARSLASRLDALLVDERRGTRVALSEDARARLRALGYVLPQEAAAETGLDPKDGLALAAELDAAEADFAVGDLERARTRLERLEPRMPGSASLHELRARIALASQRPDVALRHASRALELAPGIAQHHVLLGSARVGLGDVAGAVRAFEAALSLDPHSAQAHAGRMWRARLGAPREEVAAAAREALAQDPSGAWVRVVVADVWEELGEPERAARLYREAVELDPGEARAWVGLAVQAARLGRADLAARRLERAGAAGGTVAARVRVAIALAAAGRTDPAEALLRRVVSDAPGHRPARRVLAHLLENTGRSAEAAAVRKGPS